MGALDPAVEACDAVIPACAAELRVFHHLAPVNEREIRSAFLAGGGDCIPSEFEYRRLAFSPTEVRKSLDGAPIDEIDDRVLRSLYTEKRRELNALVSLLESRGSPTFRKRSMEIFGGPPAALILEAKDVLAEHYWADDPSLEAEEVVGLLERHLEWYRRRHPDFQCRVVLDDDMSAKLYVHEHEIHVRRGARFSREAAACDVVHEIDAHVLTFLNGRTQPCRIFEIGPRGSMAFQESLGVFVELASGVMYPGRAIKLAARVVAVAAMVGGADLTEVFRRLTVEHGLDQDEAFEICVRVFRGGGFTKDWVYLSQVREIYDYLVGGGDLGTLLVGKITLDVLDDVGRLMDGGMVLPPRFLPPWAREIERLGSDSDGSRVRDGESIGLQRIVLGGLL